MVSTRPQTFQLLPVRLQHQLRQAREGLGKQAASLAGRLPLFPGAPVAAPRPAPCPSGAHLLLAPQLPRHSTGLSPGVLTSLMLRLVQALVS